MSGAGVRGDTSRREEGAVGLARASRGSATWVSPAGSALATWNARRTSRPGSPPWARSVAHLAEDARPYEKDGAPMPSGVASC